VDASPRKARDVFLAAIKLPSDEREAYLLKACGDHQELLQRVSALLQAQAEIGSFHVAPALTVDQRITESPGTVLGPYKLLEQIGEGGMGTVWMAQQTEPIKRTVALKLIKPGMDSRQVLARFEAERQALALLDHPNIAKVHDAGVTADGRPYFVMELVKGVPITRYCDERRLTPRQRLELFVPICHAVQHAHQKGIIHRDLKPSNVLVALYDDRPVPKVIDFGVAKATGPQLTDESLHTGFGTVVGTVEYMSPEQAGFNQLDVDTRSDIYSLGVLLYELLAGSPPFTSKELEKAGVLEMLRVICEQEPSKPSMKLSMAEGLPTLAANRGTEPAKLTKLVRGELDWIVMKALEKDRSRRYETANGFAMDVQRYLADEPVLACPPSAGYRLGKLVRRHKAGLAVAALVLFFLVLLGGGIGWVMRDRATKWAVTHRLAEDAIGLADHALREGNWTEAREAVQRAEGLLDSSDSDDALQGRLRELHKDLTMVARVEQIRLEQAQVKGGHFDIGGAAPAYARAFRDYGIDVETLAPEEAAARMRARSIWVQLAAALDNWARIGNPQHRASKLAIARAVDPDPIRDRLRDALERGDQKALVELADAYLLKPELPPATVVFLAGELIRTGAVTKGEAVLRKAQQQHPHDFWINQGLGDYLSFQMRPARPDEAVRFHTAAAALRPNSPGVLLNLGLALDHIGKSDDAIAVYGRAIQLKPDYAHAFNSRGIAYIKLKQWNKAVSDCKEAIRLDPKYAQPHNNLGRVLYAKKEYDAASVEIKEAIRLDSSDALPHNNLGKVLYAKKEYDAAGAKFKEAIRLDSNLAEAHNNLGNVLYDKKEYDAASAEYKEVIRLNPKYAGPHISLGNVLYAKKVYDAAIAKFKDAIRLDPGFAAPHNGLGNALMAKGDFPGALKALQRGHELGQSDPALSLRSAREIKQCERLMELDAKLPKVQKGEVGPANAAERLALASLCQRYKKRYRDAARFYTDAFDTDPKLADPLRTPHRYNAACAAALAGCRQGEDAGTLDDKERARLRGQALNWLRADLESWHKHLAKEPDKGRALIQQTMRYWQQDVDFAGVRGAEALARLPEPERWPWQQLWDEVETLARRTAQPKK
jgi:serine/threonine protein kinase/tetratricopeptide (TPR) repeat protein